MAFWRRKKESTSVLGLDRSIEELKAEEAAAERELSVRFNRAIEKTRDTLNTRLDTIFEGRKTIDDAFLDELEEMLISTAIGVEIVQQKSGTDPAAVLFDALAAAKARNSDVLIVDTAGRLHNKANLMAELEKMKRIAAREVPGAPHETLLVIDAVTGQNGLEQAREFMKVADVTGLVLTKLDGTAKGGIAVAIAKELNLPIRYVGIGEQVNDLMVFDPETYVNGMFN